MLTSLFIIALLIVGVSLIVYGAILQRRIDRVRKGSGLPPGYASWLARLEMVEDARNQNVDIACALPFNIFTTSAGIPSEVWAIHESKHANRT